MTPAVDLFQSRLNIRPLAGGALLTALAAGLFLADLVAGAANAYGLPDIAFLLVAHRLSAGRRTKLAAAATSAMIVAAPLFSYWAVARVPAPGDLLGRVVVLLATWMVAALLRERDLAREALREQEETLEDELQRRTGEMRHVNVQLHREINERRRAEHRSRYLASIVESSEDAIIGQNLDGSIVSWNRGATRVYGFDRNEMIGQPGARLVPVDREAEMTEFFGRVARGQRVDPIETVRLRKDGALIDVSVSVSPILDESGTIVGASLIERDISRRKQAEEALQSLNADLEARVRERTEQLEAALADLDVFSRSISHDLRTPLRAVQGFGAALEQECGDRLAEEDVVLLHRMRAASARMERMIDDILSLSRASRGHLQKEIVDLGAFANEASEDLRAAHPDRRVEWRIEDGLEAYGDPALLRLVVRNLLGNAFKFSRDRNPAVIEFVAEPETDGRQILVVRDNGVGFEPAMADRLFRPFQRLHHADEFEGSGVGLATVERVLRRHGGAISAQGEVGKGATFRFQLPPLPPAARSVAAA